MRLSFRLPSLRAAVRAAALAVATVCLAPSAPAEAPAAPTWITLGEAAYQLLLAEQPGLVAAERRAVRAGAAAATETVVAVQVDASLLPRLSHAVHERLRHCGGYMVHASREDARATLDRLAAAPPTPAVAPSYAIDDRPIVDALLPRIEESRIRAGIEQLAAFRNRYYFSRHGVDAAESLARTWRRAAAGRDDVSVGLFAHGWAQPSVVMTIQGRTSPDELVVIGGHLDTITLAFTENGRSPGADDDASGVATLSEVARVLLSSGYRPRRTIQFIAYAAEEIGLRGSQEIATRYAAEGRNVVGVLQLDMTNYQGSAADIVLIGDYTNAAQNAFLADLASAYLPELTVTQGLCGYACSDHASWSAAGYAASFPFEALLGEDNPVIHTAQDTLARSGGDARHALKFGRLALTYAVELGSDGPAAAAPVARAEGR